MSYPRSFVDEATLALIDSLKLDNYVDTAAAIRGQREVSIDDIEGALHELGHVATLPRAGREDFFKYDCSLNTVLVKHGRADERGEIDANAVAILVAKELLGEGHEYEDLKSLAIDAAPSNLPLLDWKKVQPAIEKAMTKAVNQKRARWVLSLYKTLAGQ